MDIGKFISDCYRAVAVSNNFRVGTAIFMIVSFVGCFDSEALASQQNKSVGGCPAQTGVTEDDILHDRVKAYEIASDEKALLRVQGAFFHASDVEITQVISDEQSLEDSAAGQIEQKTIEATALSICKHRMYFELEILATRLINQRFGPPSGMSLNRLYLMMALSNAFVTVKFRQAFTPDQLRLYYGPFSSLLSFPISTGPTSPPIFVTGWRQSMGTDVPSFDLCNGSDPAKLVFKAAIYCERAGNEWLRDVAKHEPAEALELHNMAADMFFIAAQNMRPYNKAKAEALLYRAWMIGKQFPPQDRENKAMRIDMKKQGIAWDDQWLSDQSRFANAAKLYVSVAPTDLLTMEDLNQLSTPQLFSDRNALEARLTSMPLISMNFEGTIVDQNEVYHHQYLLMQPLDEITKTLRLRGILDPEDACKRDRTGKCMTYPDD